MVRRTNAALQHSVAYTMYWQQSEMTMQKTMIEQWKTIQDGFSSALKELGEIQKRGVEGLSTQHFEAIRRYFDTVPPQAKALTEAKDYGALLAAQSAVVKAFGEETAAYLGSMRERVEDWGSELRDWTARYLEESYKLAGLKVS